MSEISLRSATLDDAQMMLDWRNDLRTRRYFFDAGEIAPVAHLDWLRSALALPDRHLLIGAYRGQDVGVLRYDVAGAAAEVSVYLAPERAGQGLGPLLIRAGTDWVRRHLPLVRQIRANVLPGNLASLKAFERAGYGESHRVLACSLDDNSEKGE